MKLKDKVALITGSSSGIGAGVALAFAKEGARVAINYPTAEEKVKAEAIVSEISGLGTKAVAVQTDVSDEDQVVEMVAAASRSLGPVDILVNNAGIAHSATVEDMPVDMWDRMIAIHLRGTFLATRAVLPGMYERNAGKIINTASQLAYKGSPGFSHYTAAKGAILSFTRSLALEAGTRNVSVNAVAPGATHTPILEDVPADHLEAIRQSIPRGRLAEVADIVPTYVFLASDEANHYQGQCLSPNGGDVFL